MISSFSSISFLCDFSSPSSFTVIMSALTAVLNEKRSVSSSSFLIALCNTFHSVSEAVPLVQILPFVSSKSNRHSLRRKRCTPSIPFVSQGLLCSTGPRNISYMRNVSAPYFSTSSLGLTVLNFDFDIFSTSAPQKYLPFSSTKLACAYSGLQDLKDGISSSMPFTRFTSVCKLEIEMISTFSAPGPQLSSKIC